MMKSPVSPIFERTLFNEDIDYLTNLFIGWCHDNGHDPATRVVANQTLSQRYRSGERDETALLVGMESFDK